MNVPLVVKMLSETMMSIPTLGPASQSHHVTPRNPWAVSAAGPECTPTRPSRSCSTPEASFCQSGPVIPTAASRLLTTPVLVNRKYQSTVMATELVTEGK